MTLIFFYSGLSKTPSEKLSNLLGNTGLFHNKLNGFWGIRITCGHSTDNCYYCLSQIKKAYVYKSFHLFLFPSTIFLVAVSEDVFVVT